MASTPQCAKCPVSNCESTSIEKLNRSTLPENCPIRTSSDIYKQSLVEYMEDPVRRLYVPATIAEKEAYQRIRGTLMAVRPRIKELIEFAKLLNVGKIGIAFCAGLRDEARRITRFLEKQDFTVASTVCKCGAVDKTALGVDKKYKIGDSEKFESACNPVLQAKLLNKAKTEINVIVGLCIGHEMLFTMNSNAPVTTLIVKDRLLGHNPVIGLYTSYHRQIIESQDRT